VESQYRGGPEGDPGCDQPGEAADDAVDWGRRVELADSDGNINTPGDGTEVRKINFTTKVTKDTNKKEKQKKMNKNVIRKT
jgi:hypothetical protein